VNDNGFSDDGFHRVLDNAAYQNHTESFYRNNGMELVAWGCVQEMTLVRQNMSVWNVTVRMKGPFTLTQGTHVQVGKTFNGTLYHNETDQIMLPQHLGEEAVELVFTCQNGTLILENSSTLHHVSVYDLNILGLKVRELPANVPGKYQGYSVTAEEQ
jgi:phosphoribosyl-ATP pyrophosphohydrolase